MSNTKRRGRHYFVVTGSAGTTYPTDGNSQSTTKADGIAPLGTRVRIHRITELVTGSAGLVQFINGDGTAYADLVFLMPALIATIGDGAQLHMDCPLDNGFAASLSAAGKVLIEYTIES